MTSKDKPPNLALDLQYFETHSDSKTQPLKQYSDCESWGANDIFEARVSHLYDPSKFFIVKKEKEVQHFQDYLSYFYNKYGTYYIIPKSSLTLYLYCVALYDGIYYRSVIVNLPHVLCGELQAHVFCIDFGFIVTVNVHQLYKFTKHMYSVPKFSMRATLSGVIPVDFKDWREKDTSAFFNLVNGKLLKCTVLSYNKSRTILGVCLAEINSDCIKPTNYCICDILIRDKFANALTRRELNQLEIQQTMDDTRDQLKLPFNLPSLDELEWGLTVNTPYLQKVVDENTHKLF